MDVVDLIRRRRVAPVESVRVFAQWVADELLPPRRLPRLRPSELCRLRRDWIGHAVLIRVALILLGVAGVRIAVARLVE